MEDEARRLEVLRELYRQAQARLALGQSMYQEGQAMFTQDLVNLGADMIDRAREDIDRITRALAVAVALPARGKLFTQGSKSTCLKALGYSGTNKPDLFDREKERGAIDFDVSADEKHYAVWVLDESKLSRPLPKPKDR